MKALSFEHILAQAAADLEKTTLAHQTASVVHQTASVAPQPELHFLATKPNELSVYCTVRQYMQNV